MNETTADREQRLGHELLARLQPLADRFHACPYDLAEQAVGEFIERRENPLQVVSDSPPPGPCVVCGGPHMHYQHFEPADSGRRDPQA